MINEIEIAIQIHINLRTNIISCANGTWPKDWEMTSIQALDPFRCELGQWLLKIPKETLNISDINNEHARFHKCASQVLACCEKQDFSNANRLTDGNSEFIESTFKLLSLLRNLKKMSL